MPILTRSAFKNWMYNLHHHHQEMMLSLFKEIFLISLRLEFIDSEAFCGLQRLQTLELSHNKLVAPPILRPVESTLSELGLDNNCLGEIPVDYFQNFSCLSVLKLEGNRLAVLPNLSWLGESLQLIHLNDNRLVALDGLTSQGHYINLTGIYAARNEITTLNITHLNNVPKLEIMKLNKNNLTSLADFTPYYGGRMWVKGNPWHCDSNLSWVSSLNQDTFSLTCFTPQCYAGELPISLVSIEEKIHK